MRPNSTGSEDYTSSRYRRVMRYIFCFILISLIFVLTPFGTLGQDKMLANYAAMPDLRCAGGFLAADGYWTSNPNRPLEREERWVRVLDIHDVLPVKGVAVGPDEPGYRISIRHAGSGTGAVQYKVHLLQPPEVFLEFLARCQSDSQLQTLARIAPQVAFP